MSFNSFITIFFYLKEINFLFFYFIYLLFIGDFFYREIKFCLNFFCGSKKTLNDIAWIKLTFIGEERRAHCNHYNVLLFTIEAVKKQNRYFFKTEATITKNIHQKIHRFFIPDQKFKKVAEGKLLWNS